LFAGYNGRPRVFEVKANAGLSWLHFWNGGGNALGAKTALDFNFNLGKKRAHTLFVSPGVYWNLQNGAKLQFNKEQAQLALLVGYVYHFKTSNGTHHFKTYDIGAMNETLKDLWAENVDQRRQLAERPEKVVVTKVQEKIVKDVEYVNNACVVNFAKNSYVLTDEAKEVLDGVKGSVVVLGYASPEGTQSYNQKLSQKRADVVAEYLKNKGVDVQSAVGYGSVGNSSNRIVIVKTAEN
jgi:outer membrane protein OmpA-like peptidoglycan-associated protein